MHELKCGVNTGFLPQLPRPTDFVAGAVTGILPEVRLESGDWTPFLPSAEAQSGVYFDTMACVTFSALNVIEAQLNLMLATGKLPAVSVARLTELGFLKDGRFNFSDRFTAKMSGTTRSGNYLVKVWDSIRADGLLPESDWNYPRDQRDPVFVWDDYYKEIPQTLKDKAKKILEILDFNYEWLAPGNGATKAQIREWQKMAPIQIATAVCPPWNTTAVIGSCSLAVGHATMVTSAGATDWIDIFDHYTPFPKRLANTFPIPYALRGVASVKVTSAIPIDPAFGKRLSGKLMLAVEDRGSIWYITPDGKRAKIGRTPEEVTAFLQAINEKKVPVLGITNNDLAKIANV